jgi:hypothetical protein
MWLSWKGLKGQVVNQISPKEVGLVALLSTVIGRKSLSEWKLELPVFDKAHR